MNDGVRFAKSRKISILYYVCSIAIATGVLCDYAFSGFVKGFEDQRPELLTCRSWAYRPWTSCGVDGVDCLPFTNDSFPIRCPPRCEWPRGDETYQFYGNAEDGYHPLSRICPSAIHAGAVSPNGGCTVLRYNGSVPAFHGRKGHGRVESKSIYAPYYKSFVFETDVESSSCRGEDYQFGVVLTVCPLLLAGSSCLPNMPAALLVTQAVVFGAFYLQMVFYLPQFDSGMSAFTSALGCCAPLLTLLFVMWAYYGESNPFALLDGKTISDQARQWSRLELQSSNIDTDDGVDDDAKDDVAEDDVFDLRSGSRIEPFLNDDSPPARRSWTIVFTRCRVAASRIPPSMTGPLRYATIFVPLFILGLHMSLFTLIPGFDVDFTASSLSDGSHGGNRIVVLVLLSVLFIFIIVSHAVYAYRADALVPMMAAYGGVVVVVMMTRFLFLNDDKLGNVSVHVHHATIGILVLSVARFKRTISLAVAAVFLGTIVDGVCRWSEWDYVDTWTVDPATLPPESTQPMVQWNEPSLRMSVRAENASDRSSIVIAWPSGPLVETKSSDFECVGTFVLMNSEPVGQLIYKRTSHTSFLDGSCNQTRCHLRRDGLYENTDYLFSFGCISGHGNYHASPFAVVWPTSVQDEEDGVVGHSFPESGF